MSSAVVRTYSSGGNIICRKGKAYFGAFFAFSGHKKTLGKLLVCDAEILLYTQEQRKRKGNSAHKRTQQECFTILTRHIKI